MHQDESIDLREVGNIMKYALGILNVSFKVRRSIVEACDLITKRVVWLAICGIVGILKNIGRDGALGVVGGKVKSDATNKIKRTIIAIDVGLYENYPKFRNYLQLAIVELLRGKYLNISSLRCPMMDFVLELHLFLHLIPFMLIINGCGFKRKLISAINNFHTFLLAGVLLVLKLYIVLIILLYYMLATDNTYFTICKMYLIRIFPGHFLRLNCIDLLVNGEESVYHELCGKKKENLLCKMDSDPYYSLRGSIISLIAVLQESINIIVLHILFIPTMGSLMGK